MVRRKRNYGEIRPDNSSLATLFRRFLDKEADLVLESAFTIRVRIIDIRRAYGRVDFRVEAIMGTGSAWVSTDRLTMIDDPVHYNRRDV